MNKVEHEFLIDILQGNMLAVSFCESLFRISQVWDDLIDGDKPVSNDQITMAFWLALVSIPNNQFYFQNAQALNPLIQAFIIDWMDANSLEEGSDHEKNIAFVLRDSVGAIVIHCAQIIGGYHYMRKVSASVRRFIHDETLSSYKEALKE